MPNHLHVLIAFRHTDKTINSIIGNGKRFMAYDLVSKLKETNQNDLLLELSSIVIPTERRRGKLHDVFEPSFDWKECYGDEFIEQKLNYIHENPCRGKWSLVKQPWDYVHSSAKFYFSGEEGVYPVINFMALKDIELTRCKGSDRGCGTEAQSPRSGRLCEE